MSNTLRPFVPLQQVEQTPQNTGVRVTDPTLGTNFSTTFGGDYIVYDNSFIKLDLQNSTSLKSMLRNNPNGLLRKLRSVSPALNLAINNMTQLGFPAKSLKITWHNEDDTINTKETKFLQEWIRSWPSEVPSLTGLGKILMIDAFLANKRVIEVVPSKVVLDTPKCIYPVLPESVITARKTATADFCLLQYRREQIASNPLEYNGWKTYELNPQDVLWIANQQSTDAMEGVVPYSSALLETLSDLYVARDFRDAIDNVGHPTRDFGVDIENLHKIAVETMNITDPKEAAEYVALVWSKLEESAKNVKPNQNTIHDSKSTVKVNQGGNFNYITPGLEYLRHRHTASLLSLPAMHGLGETTNVGSIEYALYAATIESAREESFELMERGFVRVQRLRGVSGYCKITGQKIKDGDELVQASLREIKLRTGVLEVALGFHTLDTLCQNLNGKAREAKEIDGVVESVAKVTAQPDANGSRQTNRSATANQPTPGNPTNVK